MPLGSDLGHLELMLSCFALHIFNLYIASLIIRKTRNCLITACNYHCTYYTCTTHVSTDHGASTHPSVAHIACFPTFWEAWPMPKPSPIRQHNPHNMPTCSTHQVTTISPLVSVRAFSQHPPAQCLAHSICLHILMQPSSALHTSNQAHTQATSN